jgi:serine phosphatase RsbU (regulator of sigma subunit)
MGKIRFFLRAVMRDESDPSRVLSRVHDLLLTEAMDELATCMIGRWDPVARTLTIASAGHLPPLATDEATSVVPIAPDPPLGTPNVAFTQPNTVIDIVGPMRLLLYTDGVVERRDEIIDESIAALAKRLATTVGQPLEVAADTILDQATSSGEDDMALLLIDFTG